MLSTSPWSWHVFVFSCRSSFTATSILELSSPSFCATPATKPGSSMATRMATSLDLPALWWLPSTPALPWKQKLPTPLWNWAEGWHMAWWSWTGWGRWGMRPMCRLWNHWTLAKCRTCWRPWCRMTWWLRCTQHADWRRERERVGPGEEGLQRNCKKRFERWSKQRTRISFCSLPCSYVFIYLKFLSMLQVTATGLPPLTSLPLLVTS